MLHGWCVTTQSNYIDLFPSRNDFDQSFCFIKALWEESDTPHLSVCTLKQKDMSDLILF